MLISPLSTPKNIFLLICLIQCTIGMQCKSARSIIPLHYLICLRYYLFQSSLIPVFCITTEPTSPDAAAWGADIEAAKRILETVNTHSDKARKFLDVLNRLYSSLDEMEGFMETMQQDGDLMGMIYGQMQGAPESAQKTGGLSIQQTEF